MTKPSNFIRRALRGGAAFRALALLGAGVTMSVVLTAPATAQDYTNVTASGRVQSTSGQPVPNATIEMRSNDQGYSRSITTDASGVFRLPQVPPGTYTFTVSADGFDSFTDDAVVLAPGASANQFTLAAAGESGTGDIVVTAGRIQVADFDKTTTGAVVNIGELSTRVPVARSLRDIILLTPGTIRGGSAQNAAFANQATIGGSSFAENAYYVNGLNITEFRQGFSPVPIPFDFYQTVDIKTGGLPAEFGRATGGVVVATTKAGSNDFHGSVLFNWSPDDLREKTPNTYAADNDGNFAETKEAIFQLSGPIIKDHLFFYGIYNARNVVTIATGAGAQDALGNPNPAGNRATRAETKDPFYGGKVDGFLWGQHLEFTYFDTTQTTNNGTYAYNSDTNQRSNYISGSNVRAGGENYVGRYTGTITNWLTLSAAYGVNKNRAGSLPLDTVRASITDSRNPLAPPTALGNSSNSQVTNDDKREFYRGDVDLSVKLLGAHHFRFGYDHEELTATQLSQTLGAGITTYLTATGTDASRLPAGTQYVTVRTFMNGGSFNTINEAFYAQDSWSLFGDRLNLQLGVRNDRFDNRDAAGNSFYKSGDQWAPRLGFTVDPIGDGSTKIYGSFSRYYLPIAANTNIRGAGAELDFTRYNVLTGVNADGSPIVGAPATNVLNGRACPDTGINNCVVTRDGSVNDPSSFQSQSLKPQSEDQYILGIERRVGTRIKVGAYYTHTKLGQVLEDAAIDQAANAYCVGKGFTAAQCGRIWSGFSQYVLLNPGEDAAIKLLPLPDGSTPTVNFTAAQLGYPKAVRNYDAMTFTFDREFDGKWSFSGSYTLSANVGNYEGGVKSDIGQADTGATEDFDQPGFSVGAYGYLPNHRRHNIKLYGSYQIGDFLTVGANATFESPKKFGCVGVVPTSVDPFAAQYDGGGFFCSDANGVQQLTPRGRSFESDWRKAIDLSFNVRIPADFDASVRIDLFNILNDKSALDFDEIGDVTLGTPSGTYGQPLVYQAARSARIQFRVGF